MSYFANVKPPNNKMPPINPPNHYEQLLKSIGMSYVDTFYNQSPNDHCLWIELYVVAAYINVNLAYRLEFIRNAGSVLMLDNTWGFIIQPVIDPSGVNGWRSWQHYQAEGQVELRQFNQEVIQCLGELRRRYDSGKIVWY